jgi:hypothetical protein
MERQRQLLDLPSLDNFLGDHDDDGVFTSLI